MRNSMVGFGFIAAAAVIILTGLIGCTGDKAPDTPTLSSEAARKTEKAADEKTAPPAALTDANFDLELPLDQGTQAVLAKIPRSWTRNPDFGSIVFQPPDKDDVYYPPLIQYTASCGGSCDAAAIPGNIETTIQGIKDGLSRPNINSGDAEQDAIRANVEILLEEKYAEDGWILAAAVTYPEELSSALYVPKVVVHAFRHHSGDKFFIQTSAHAALDQKDELLAVLTSACRSTDF